MTRNVEAMLGEVLKAVAAVAHSPVHAAPGGRVTLLLSADVLVGLHGAYATALRLWLASQAGLDRPESAGAGEAEGEGEGEGVTP